VVGLLVLALVLGFVGGHADPLPGAALGSPLVLHLERSVAIFAGLFLGLLVVSHAFRGELPTELSGRGVTYASRDGVDALRSELRETLAELRTINEEHAGAIDDLDARLVTIEGVQ
jgi:hypothetical protein